MSAYLFPDDCHFNIPSSEINNFMETLMEGVQFIRLLNDIIDQRKLVFEVAVHELKQTAVLRQNECLSMDTSQFAIKLLEFYYSMDFPLLLKDIPFLLCYLNIIKHFLMYFKIIVNILCFL